MSLLPNMERGRATVAALESAGVPITYCMVAPSGATVAVYYEDMEAAGRAIGAVDATYAFDRGGGEVVVVTMGSPDPGLAPVCVTVYRSQWALLPLPVRASLGITSSPATPRIAVVALGGVA